MIFQAIEIVAFLLLCFFVYRIAFIRGYRKGAFYVLNDIKESIREEENTNER